MKLTKGKNVIGLGILSLCLGAAIGAYFSIAQSVPKLINYQGLPVPSTADRQFS